MVSIYYVFQRDLAQSDYFDLEVTNRMGSRPPVGWHRVCRLLPQAAAPPPQTPLDLLYVAPIPV